MKQNSSLLRLLIASNILVLSFAAFVLLSSFDAGFTRKIKFKEKEVINSPIGKRIIVTGRILSYDGLPLKLAYIYPGSIEQSKGVSFLPGKHLKVAEDGSFIYDSEFPMPFVIYITGIYHEPFLLLVESQESNEINYEIRLARHTLRKSGPLYVRGSFNSFASSKTVMNEVKPGIFQAEVNSEMDSISYLIEGLDNYLNLPGQEGIVDKFHSFAVKSEYFITKQKVINKKLLITIDVNKFPSGFDTVGIKANSNYAENVAIAFSKFDKLRNNYFREYMTHLRNGDESNLFKFDWQSYEKELRKKILDKKHLPVESLFYFSIGEMNAPVDTSLVRKEIGQFPSESEYWNIYTAALKWYERLFDYNTAKSKLSKIFSKNQDQKIKAAALYYLIELQKQYGLDYNDYYETLQTAFAQSSFAETAKDKYNPLGLLSRGKRIPEFTLELFDSSQTINTRLLKNKYYLFDFWATWCAPCIAEFPGLEKAYSKYKSNNFEILSISIDDNIEKVIEFRQRKFRMPWLHVILKKGYDDPLLSKLNIRTIPRMVLVDPTGLIIATDDELRNGKLEIILKSVFKN